MDDTALFAEEIFGFHAQQAAEKALKAWLASLSIDYPKTHDLRLLPSLLEQSGAGAAPFWEVVDLDVFAVQFRYTTYEDAGAPLDRAGTRAAIGVLIEVVAAILRE